MGTDLPVPTIYQTANAPQPLAPLPTPSLFHWHQQELQIFIHFGVNTFNGKGWGDGKGDVVGGFIKACRKYGLGLGI